MTAVLPTTKAASQNPEKDAFLSLEDKLWDYWKAKQPRCVSSCAATDGLGIVTDIINEVVEKTHFICALRKTDHLQEILDHGDLSDPSRRSAALDEGFPEDPNTQGQASNTSIKRKRGRPPKISKLMQHDTQDIAIVPESHIKNQKIEQTVKTPIQQIRRTDTAMQDSSKICPSISSRVTRNSVMRTGHPHAKELGLSIKQEISDPGFSILENIDGVIQPSADAVRISDPSAGEVDGRLEIDLNGIETKEPSQTSLPDVMVTKQDHAKKQKNKGKARTVSVKTESADVDYDKMTEQAVSGKKHRCFNCGATFPRRHDLRVHLKEHHSGGLLLNQ